MSSSHRAPFISPCSSASNKGGCTCDISCNPVINVGDLTVDVSCQPIVYVDVSCYPILNIGDLKVDVSCQPIVYVDVSCYPIVHLGPIDVSCQPIVYVDVSCYPIVNLGPIDVSCQPIVYVDVSCYPIVNLGPIDVSCQPIVYVDVSCYPIVNLGPIDVSCQPIVYVDVSCYPIVQLDISLNQALTATNFDAFGRLRVSNPFTLFEFNSILGKNEYNIQESISATNASSTHVAGKSYVDMSVTGAGGSVVRQSREYIMYQPGKSKLVYMTGVLYSTGNGYTTNALTSRIGVFDASMGFYVQMQNGVISVVEHNSVMYDIARSSWTDPLDGTGPSGVNVDFTKAQIFYFDFEWLGVGQVRCGIIQSGKYLPYYTFTHANALTAPYIQMAKLPLRYEITSTGSTNSTHMICGTVISEGGISPLGKLFTYTNFADPTIPGIDKNAAAYQVIWGIQLLATPPYNRVTIKIKDIQLCLSDTTTVIAWQLVLNPQLTGSLPSPPLGWINYSATSSGTNDPYKGDSAIQIYKPAYTGSGNSATVSTTCSGGHIVSSGFCIGKTSITTMMNMEELVAEYPIGSNINGEPDTLILAAIVPAPSRSGSGNANVYISAQWTEIM